MNVLLIIYVYIFIFNKYISENKTAFKILWKYEFLIFYSEINYQRIYSVIFERVMAILRNGMVLGKRKLLKCTKEGKPTDCDIC